MNQIPPIRVSVSQIRKFMRCQYAWWREYGPLLAKPPPKPAASLGTKVHLILDDYLTEGKEPPDTKAGRIAACGLDKLPDPETIEVEKSITLPLSENSSILCRIDMVSRDNYPAYIGDHKTTSDFGWCKSRSELSRDVQLLTYAMAAFHETKPPEVKGELIYYRTRNLPVSLSVSVSLPWGDIEKNWESLKVIAEEMAPKKVEETGETCTHNTSACGDYGGCYHAPLCPFSPQNRQNDPSTLAKLTTSDNITPATQDPKLKKETLKMDITEIQKNVFGILPPDVAPEAEQTDPLLSAAAEKLKEGIELFKGHMPGETVKSLLVSLGIDPKNFHPVMEMAGLKMGVDGTVNATEPEPEKPTFQPKRKPPCNDKIIRQHASTLRQKVNATAGGIAEDIVRAWFAEQIAPNKISDSRWERLVRYSELTLDGCWFHSKNPEGYTEEIIEVETEDTPKTGAQQDIEEYERKTGKSAYKGQKVTWKDLPNQHALNGALVVLVDARFNQTPQNAVTFDRWILPHIATLEKLHRESFAELDVEYGKGPKLLAPIVSAAFHKTPPSALILMNSSHPCAAQILPVFVNAGAVVIYGR